MATSTKDRASRVTTTSTDGNVQADLDRLSSAQAALQADVARLRQVSADKVTPEEFGAVGNGTVDDTAAFNAALATGKDVVLNPAKTYRVTDSLVFPNTATIQTLYGNSALIRADGLFLLFKQRSADGVTILNDTVNKNFFDIRAVGNAAARSVYTQVVNSQFLRISKGVAENLYIYGFCNGISLMGNARVMNVRADEIRNAAVRGEGHDNLFIGLIANSIAGDVVLIKSFDSLFANIYCKWAGVSPADSLEPPTLRDQGALISFAQDGQNAERNVVANAACSYYGASFVAFSGTGNKMVGELVGGSFYEAGRAKGASNAVYMAGTNNWMGAAQYDLVYSGIEMHNGSTGCYVGPQHIREKSGYGTYVVSVNGTTSNSRIESIYCGGGAFKTNDVYLASAGTSIGKIEVRNLTGPTSGGSPVAVSAAMNIDKIVFNQATSATTTLVNMTVSAAAYIKEIAIENCLGTSLIVTADGFKSDRLYLRPRASSTVPAIDLKGPDANATFHLGTLLCRGGPALASSRVAGTVTIAGYSGPSWARSDASIAGVAIYATPENHTLS